MDKDTYSEFIAEFMNETDRAAIVLGAAQVDDLLAQILEKRLIGSVKELLDVNGPIGTFSSRINMCHASGVIDKEFCNSIHAIRKLRNTCAHSIKSINLDIPPICNQIRSLSSVYENSQGWSRHLSSAEEVFNKSGNSLTLRIVLAFIIANLSMILMNVKQIQVKDSKSVLILK